MKALKKQAGFTLIELVIVIVILGILAATAAPKFIDLQGDAKGATIQAVKASIETAVSAVHAKSLIAGNDNVAKATGATVTVYGSTTVTIGSGWPLATTANFASLLDINAADFTTEVSASDATKIVIFPKGFAADADAAVTAKCYVHYIESTDTNTKPSIAADISGC
jgi:MSHA pilin protein MshA